MDNFGIEYTDDMREYILSLVNKQVSATAICTGYPVVTGTVVLLTDKEHHTGQAHVYITDFAVRVVDEDTKEVRDYEVLYNTLHAFFPEKTEAPPVESPKQDVETVFTAEEVAIMRTVMLECIPSYQKQSFYDWVASLFTFKDSMGTWNDRSERIQEFFVKLGLLS